MVFKPISISGSTFWKGYNFLKVFSFLCNSLHGKACRQKGGSKMSAIIGSCRIGSYKENPALNLNKILVTSCLLIFIIGLVTGILGYAKNASAATACDYLPKCAYIYQTDTTTPQEFNTLLFPDYCCIYPISMSDVPSIDFSVFDLIIIGGDTITGSSHYQDLIIGAGHMDCNWNPTKDCTSWPGPGACGADSSYAVAVDSSGKPILGLGYGGAAFFDCVDRSRLPDSSWIGWLHSWGLGDSGIYVMQPTHQIFTNPNIINIPSPPILPLYSSSIFEVGAYIPSPPPDITLLGRETNALDVNHNHYSVLEQGRYFKWGFAGGPSAMTPVGEALFFNIIAYLTGYYPPQGPVAYYPFNGNANDESGNGNNGAVSGGGTFTTDRFGNPNSAFSSTTTSYIDIPESVSLDLQSAFTLSAWFKMEQVTHAYSALISKDYSTGYSIGIDSGGSGVCPAPSGVVRNMRIMVANQNTYFNSDFSCNTWYHVAVTYDDNTNQAQLYVNGSLVDTQTVTASPNINSYSLGIGRDMRFLDKFVGVIDDVRIYNRVLTSDEILQLPGPVISGITPDHGGTNENQLFFTLYGSGFQTGATVELTNFVIIDPTGKSSIDANVVVVTPTQMTGTFNLTTGVPTGPYNVVVANPDGQSAILANGFTVQDTTPPVTTASPVGGTYNNDSSNPLKVTLTANEPATIHYTVDGSLPDATSPVYSGPIDITATTTLRFFAIDVNNNNEVPKTEIYLMNPAYAVTAVVDPPTNELILPVTSTFTFPPGTQTFEVSCYKVNHILRDSIGNPLPPADYLKGYVIGPADTPGSDVKTYSAPVSVTCDLARFYSLDKLTPGIIYKLEVNFSNHFVPPEVPPNFFKGSLSATTDVTVTSAIQTHLITASVGTPGGNIYLGGSIVSGPVKVLDGSSPTFNIIHDTSYVVADVQVDGSSMGAVTSYQFPAVTGDHTIAATFTKWNHSGFFPPIDNLPMFNSVKAGQAVPVKFSLGGNMSLDIFQSGYPRTVDIPCPNSSALVDTIEQTVDATTSKLLYDAASDQYNYIWKTNKGWANTCLQLQLGFKDGVVQSANFKFTK